MNRRAWAYDNFHAFLRRLLASRSTHQIASRTGVDHSTIARIAHGRPPLLSTAKAVIDVYVR
jgi:transcriptional regulator with XRE-family HTH domain